MLLQAGTNGNIYSYNYSLQQKRTEIPSDAAGDIVLHGNYPYANLFEGNIAQNVGGDASHGRNGPANVFFRNRAMHYGIAFTSGSGDSSIVMYNEVTATGNSSIFPGSAIGRFRYYRSQHDRFKKLPAIVRRFCRQYGIKIYT